MDEYNHLYGVKPRQDLLSKALLFKYLIIFSVSSIFLSVLISSLFGAISGGIIGKWFSTQNVINQPIKEVSEQSGVISAVKSANPAVVSIIISKEVPNIPQFNPLDPFSFMNGDNNNGGTTKKEIGGGSGFIIQSNGLILTNKHVAHDVTSDYTIIMTNGKQYKGHIVATDPTNDIAIIKVDAANLPTVVLGSSANLQLGQTVIAIGNALGQYNNTVSVGVVSGKNRTLTASDSSGATSETLSNVLQTDAQINPGNSGGPLLDINGNVVAINTAIAQNAQGIGFAIPIEQAKNDISSVEKTGKITRPQLGVRYKAIDQVYLNANPSTPFDYGAIITGESGNQPGVIPGSPADKAGIQQGDIILDVNNTRVDTTNPLGTLIQQHNVGETLSLHLYHLGKEKDVSIVLEKSVQ